MADVHRTLLYGGIFGYPDDKKSKDGALHRSPVSSLPKHMSELLAKIPGKLRMLYEAFPMAYLTEQAGGLATTGSHRILDVVPSGIHGRCPVWLGSKEDIEDVQRCYAEYTGEKKW